MPRLRLSLFALAFSLAAFGPAAAAARPVIGAVIYARDSQFWALIEQGMRDAARDEDVGIQVALNRRQRPTEAQVMDDLMTRQVQAIVMSPLDKDASATAAAHARRRGSRWSNITRSSPTARSRATASGSTTRNSRRRSGARSPGTSRPNSAAAPRSA